VTGAGSSCFEQSLTPLQRLIICILLSGVDLHGKPDLRDGPRPEPAPAALSKATLWPFAVSIGLPSVALVAVLVLTPFGRSLVSSMAALTRPQRTVEERLAEFGRPARDRWRERFKSLGIQYPPQGVTLVGLKEERVLHVYVRMPADKDGSPPAWALAASYPVLGASGVAGPKLREGDGQVPEGVYRVPSLHPNSSFHAALRLDYPNEFDRSMAARDGRADQGVRLGGDIMIHGGDQSVGCLAIGDPAIEEIFTLAADSGTDAISVVIAPWDLRARPAPESAALDDVAASWSPELYRAIGRVLASLGADAEGG
jgi:hypothetical protein